jgi:putative transposase
MSQHPERFYGERDLHFVTFSCHQRCPFLDDPLRRDLFLTTLARVRRTYRLVVVGYVVMPEHVHLLLSEPQRRNLSFAIQALKLGFVRRLRGDGVASADIPTSRKIGETWGTPVGGVYRLRGDRSACGDYPRHFWTARFYDFNVWTEKKRIEKLNYIHNNPVRRGLVASPEEWGWSSCRWYLKREAGPVEIEDTDILVMTVRPRAADPFDMDELDS